MKNIQFIIWICFLSIMSCEEVINLDLPTTPPRLVIDASLNWVKNTPGNEQYIKLTLTAPYYNESVPPATGAIVTVSDLNNNTFTFSEINNSGIYVTNTFIPVINGIYTLNIIYNNETYTATESLVPVVPIDYINQNDNGGFSGESIEIEVYYTDPENTKNYYFFEFINATKSTNDLEVYDDEYSNGNQIFAYYSNDDIEPGDELVIKNSGISELTYQYIYVLLQQISGNGGTFETIPATVRGNCVNETNFDNYALGFFRITETDIVTYTVQ